MCVCVCVCVCVLRACACMLACVCVCVCVCVFACLRACVRVRVCCVVGEKFLAASGTRTHVSIVPGLVSRTLHQLNYSCHYFLVDITYKKHTDSAQY